MADVLLVDDDGNFRWTLKFLLKNEGDQVDEATDALQATELMLRQTYDVVVTDVVFTRGNWLDIWVALAGRKTQVIVATALPWERAREIADCVEPCRYWEKGCGVERLLHAVRCAALDSGRTKRANGAGGQASAPASVQWTAPRLVATQHHREGLQER